MNMNMDRELSKRLKAARALAEAAGKMTLRWFGAKSLAVESKSDASPVTIADRSAERWLREQIADKFPNDSIVGEEFPAVNRTGAWRWILDPIDGTKSFIHNVPLYSTLVGLQRDGVSQIGVVALPALDVMLWGTVGSGAWTTSPRSKTPKRATVSETRTLRDSLFLTSEVATFDKISRRDVYEKLESRCRLTRTWGDAYGYYLVATGQAEVMVDPLMNIWDAAPLLVILEEAGGRFTDWRGHPVIDGGNGIGSNGLVHNAVKRIVKTCT
ncbi:MAG: inositol monophosphatase family protein [Thermoguttaceae bacterium]